MRPISYTEPPNEVLGRTPGGAATTDLILQIFRANGRLLRAGDVLTRDFGLTSARWQVLGAIDGTPKTVAQIARDYELTRQGILWVVRTMVKDGLVELVRNPDHRRAKLVCLTEKGQTITNEVIRRQVEWSNELGRSFRMKQLEVAIDCIARLGEIAMNRGDNEGELD